MVRGDRICLDFCRLTYRHCSENAGGSSPLSIASDPEECHENIHLQETLRSLGHFYSNMADKVALPDNRFLEDVLYQHVLTLEELSPAHFFIVDDKLLDGILKTPEEKQEVLRGVVRFPPFPKNLRKSMMQYRGAKTAAQCRAIARDSPDNQDIQWIDDVFRHVYVPRPLSPNHRDMETNCWRGCLAEQC